ncbi:aspartic proteinase CDR1-like [Mercurialis annua]|uniref:aspartic proteinase CDR1-like n=1 Tax=Mercurialis annua TaxID=3986 RepID=UPI0024AF0519|nr:aspartic proteinase CDR1-like [Mercurialis annua]
MDSFIFHLSIFKLSLLATSLSFSFSLPITESPKGNGIAFQTPLIHWSSPESPFYEPNLTPGELMQASVRTSRARGNHLHNKIMLEKSGNVSYSRKYPISRLSIIDKVYVMKFHIGSPPVETYAIPDTGSDLVWVQCGPICPHCYKQRIPLFDSDKSSTYEVRNCTHPDCLKALWWLGQSQICTNPRALCGYQTSYEDGSYSEGTIGSDILTFPGHISEFGNYTLRTFFGCGYNNSAVPGEDPDEFNSPGVVGLANQMASLVGQLALGQFSYCISLPSVQKPNQTIEIRFGPAASVSGHSTAIVSDLNGWYFFKSVEGIYLDNTRVVGYPDWVFQFSNGGHGGLIIDTGTTYTELYHLAFNALVQSLTDFIAFEPDRFDESNSNYSLCYSAEGFADAYLPTIEFRFKDNQDTFLDFGFDNSWIYNGSDQYCLAMFSTTGVSIIGIYQQRGIKFGYDLKNSVVSFTDSPGCDVTS